MTIGQRAAQLIKERAKKNNRRVEWELLLLEINEATFRDWQKGRYEPSAYFLQNMARNGYDIMYILLGDEVNA
jgi:hypothetical protein